MEDKTGKILNITLYVLIGISVVLGIFFVFIKDIPSDPEVPAVADITMLHMFWAYFLLIAAAIIAIAAPIIYVILNPAKAKPILMGIIAFVVLGGIAYLLASSGTDAPVYDKFEISADASKRVGTGLIATYILGILAVGVTLFSGIAKMFK